MPNPLIDMLSKKLHLLQTQWNALMTTSQMLRQALEVFQMEVGLSVNVLEEDYMRLGNLASDEWWKHFWQLCHWFEVKVLLSQKWMIPLLRSGDRSLMDIICSTDFYSPCQHESINRVHKYKGAYSQADITLCDGCSLDCWTLTNAPLDSTRIFSVERPTASDFCLFWGAICLVFSAELSLLYTLG